MINLIIGTRGSGKTKHLIEIVNETAKTSKGNVVCIEKGDTLKFNASPQVKLCNIDEYEVNGYETYYGFLCGICAGNYDITDIFCDATFRIVGEKDFDLITRFLKKVDILSKNSEINFTFTLSCKASDLPGPLFTFAKEI